MRKKNVKYDDIAAVTGRPKSSLYTIVYRAKNCPEELPFNQKKEVKKPQDVEGKLPPKAGVIIGEKDSRYTVSESLERIAERGGHEVKMGILRAAAQIASDIAKQ